ncbi:unnamed protein product [Mycena citricolor]|uniref:Uncharacterized protein n=1 Tax=Mycena citricolor TaxID=2018698 RepID=A0AAD2HQ91_9AGAR|nr:unnamed protein product [Mycena citricolor]
MGITPAAWPCASALLTKAKEKREKATYHELHNIDPEVFIQHDPAKRAPASTVRSARIAHGSVQNRHLPIMTGCTPCAAYSGRFCSSECNARSCIGITRSLPVSGSRAISRVSHEGYTTRVRTVAAGPNGGTRARCRRADSSSPS